MKTALLAALMFAAGAAHAQLAYKGLAFGSAVDALTARLPSIECRAIPRGSQFSRLGEQHCTESVCGTPACAASRQEVGTFGGAPVWDPSFAVVAGRVERFAANFDAASYETIRDALREAHGAGVETLAPMQTLGGARIESRAWSAAVPGGRVSVFERAGRLNEGTVSLESAVFTDWSRRPTDAGKNAKDL